MRIQLFTIEHHIAGYTIPVEYDDSKDFEITKKIVSFTTDGVVKDSTIVGYNYIVFYSYCCGYYNLSILVQRDTEETDEIKNILSEAVSKLMEYDFHYED